MTRRASPLFRARPDGGTPGDKIRPRREEIRPCRDAAATYAVGVDCEHILVADVALLGLPPAGETAHEGWASGIVAAALRALPA